MDYSLQLYSVQDFCSVDMDYTFSRIQEFGYTGVEYAGFYGYSKEELKEALDKYNFKAVGLHLPIDEYKKNFASVMDTVHHLGITDVGVGWANVSDEENLRYAINSFNELNEMAKKEGLGFYYHLHDTDHKPTKDSGVIPFDAVINETDIKIEFDTFWEFYSGLDPVEQLKKYKDRLCGLVHIKDGSLKCEPKELGEGDAPIKEAMDYVIGSGLSIILESEGRTPDSLTEVKHCSKFLKRNYPDLFAPKA